MIDVEKLLKLRKEYIHLLDKNTELLHRAADNSLPWEEAKRLCKEAYAMNSDIENAEYKYKQYISSLNPEDLDVLDDESYERIGWMLFLDCPEFQKKAFVRYLDERKNRKNE